MFDYNKIINDGITIFSSGTSGNSKSFFQPPKKIQAANLVAITAQELTSNSKIYTCCKLTHAGGLFAQTIPAISIGAKVDIEPFNAYHFISKIKKYSHTHITPLHAKAIMMTKGFKTIDLNGIWITCGAEPVTWDIISSFVERGAKFMVNWGMSEIGPIAINVVFDSLDKVNEIKSYCPDNATILGHRAYCDYNIINNELIVKGDISIFDSWYCTKDIVVEKNGFLFYTGRTNKNVDLWNPIKG